MLVCCIYNKTSLTTRPISTKLDGKHAWRWGFRIKEAGPLWGPIEGKIRKILINLHKSSSHKPLARMNWYLVWSILGEKRF